MLKVIVADNYEEVSREAFRIVKETVKILPEPVPNQSQEDRPTKPQGPALFQASGHTGIPSIYLYPGISQTSYACRAPCTVC